MFRHLRDAVIVANAGTERIVAWNDHATHIFGYAEDEALELPLHALVPPHLRDRHRAGLAGYQSTGRGDLIDAGQPVELVGLHKEGHEVPIELTLTKIPEATADGHRFALAIVRDITDRKEAERARSERRNIEADRRRALELNDAVVQGLAIAKMALETGRVDTALDAVTETLENARVIVTRLLSQIEEKEGPLSPGDFRRGVAPPEEL